MPDYEKLFGGVSPLHDSLNEAMLATKTFAEQFRMPQLTEYSLLASELSAASKLAGSFGGFEMLGSEITEAMRSMRSPWLMRDDVMRSAHAFAEIQQIGRALSTVAPFDAALAQSLRGALGDWRDVTTVPATILDNVIARTDFYTELGFDSSLTDFTAQAFDESTALAGLSGTPEEGDEDSEEIGLARTNWAHGQLARFERNIRRFIDTAMKAEFGEDWPRQLPDGMLELWEKNKQTALDKGEKGAAPDRLCGF